MTGAKHPMAEANRISTVLKQVLGPDRFPVKVDEVAMEYSRQRFANSPVAKVDGQDLAGFDGMLTANASRSKWLPDAEWRVPQYDDEKPLEDTFDRFIHNGQPVVR